MSKWNNYASIPMTFMESGITPSLHEKDRVIKLQSLNSKKTEKFGDASPSAGSTVRLPWWFLSSLKDILIP